MGATSVGRDAAEPYVPADALALPAASALGVAGLAVAWTGPLGTAVAWMRSATALEAGWARHVGREEPGVGRPQVAFAGNDALVLAWCDVDGGHVAALARQDGSWLHEPFACFPNGRQVALASRDSQTLAAAVDDEGISVRRAAAPEALAEASSVRVVSQRGLDPLLAATELGSGWLLAYSLAAERLFGLCTLSADGTTRDVRHRVRSEVVALHASSAGTQAAVVLGYAGADAERIDGVVVSSDGTLSERPHRLLEELGAELGAPHVHFMESAFVVAGVRAPRGQLYLGSRRGQRATSLAGVPLDASIGFFADRIVACAVRQHEAVTLLQRGSCSRGGGEVSRGVLPLVPADAAVRLSRVRTRQMLVDAGASLGGSAYRSAGSQVALEPGRLSLCLRKAESSARLQMEPDDAGIRIDVASWRGAPGAPAPTTSLVRLMRWLRARFSTEARRTAEDAERWAAALAELLGATVERIDWVEGARAVVLRVAAPPRAEQTSRTLLRALEWT